MHYIRLYKLFVRITKFGSTSPVVLKPETLLFPKNAKPKLKGIDCIHDVYSVIHEPLVLVNCFIYRATTLINEWSITLTKIFLQTFIPGYVLKNHAFLYIFPIFTPIVNHMNWSADQCSNSSCLGYNSLSNTAFRGQKWPRKMYTNSDFGTFKW